MYEGSGLLFDLPLLMAWSACFGVYCWDSVGAVWFRLRALERYFELEQYEWAVSFQKRTQSLVVRSGLKNRILN